MKIILIILIILTSCEIESCQIPCGVCIEIVWNIKKNPIIEVPITGCLYYDEIKAKLYDDFDNFILMENVKAKQDTVILEAPADLSCYQKCMQKCEIYLIEFDN